MAAAPRLDEFVSSLNAMNAYINRVAGLDEDSAVSGLGTEGEVKRTEAEMKTRGEAQAKALESIMSGLREQNLSPTVRSRLATTKGTRQLMVLVEMENILTHTSISKDCLISEVVKATKEELLVCHKGVWKPLNKEFLYLGLAALYTPKGCIVKKPNLIIDALGQAAVRGLGVILLTNKNHSIASPANKDGARRVLFEKMGDLSKATSLEKIAEEMQQLNVAIKEIDAKLAGDAESLVRLAAFVPYSMPQPVSFKEKQQVYAYLVNTLKDFLPVLLQQIREKILELKNGLEFFINTSGNTSSSIFNMQFAKGVPKYVNEQTKQLILAIVKFEMLGVKQVGGMQACCGRVAAYESETSFLIDIQQMVEQIGLFYTLFWENMNNVLQQIELMSLCLGMSPRAEISSKQPTPFQKRYKNAILDAFSRLLKEFGKECSAIEGFNAIVATDPNKLCTAIKEFLRNQLLLHFGQAHLHEKAEANLKLLKEELINQYRMPATMIKQIEELCHKRGTTASDFFENEIMTILERVTKRKVMLDMKFEKHLIFEYFCHFLDTAIKPSELREDDPLWKDPSAKFPNYIPFLITDFIFQFRMDGCEGIYNYLFNQMQVEMGSAKQQFWGAGGKRALAQQITKAHTAWSLLEKNGNELDQSVTYCLNTFMTAFRQLIGRDGGEKLLAVEMMEAPALDPELEAWLTLQTKETAVVVEHSPGPSAKKRHHKKRSGAAAAKPAKATGPAKRPAAPTPAPAVPSENLLPMQATSTLINRLITSSSQGTIMAMQGIESPEKVKERLGADQRAAFFTLQTLMKMWKSDLVPNELLRNRIFQTMLYFVDLCNEVSSNLHQIQQLRAKGQSTKGLTFSHDTAVRLKTLGYPTDCATVTHIKTFSFTYRFRPFLTPEQLAVIQEAFPQILLEMENGFKTGSLKLTEGEFKAAKEVAVTAKEVAVAAKEKAVTEKEKTVITGALTREQGESLDKAHGEIAAEIKQLTEQMTTLASIPHLANQIGLVIKHLELLSGFIELIKLFPHQLFFYAFAAVNNILAKNSAVALARAVAMRAGIADPVTSMGKDRHSLMKYKRQFGFGNKLDKRNTDYFNELDFWKLGERPFSTVAVLKASPPIVRFHSEALVYGEATISLEGISTPVGGSPDRVAVIQATCIDYFCRSANLMTALITDHPLAT